MAAKINNMIRSRTAYKIGFSSSLSEDTWSPYNELTKWEILQSRRERSDFIRGYSEGLKIVREVRRENTLAAGRRVSDEA